jgi:hypothetical protein
MIVFKNVLVIACLILVFVCCDDAKTLTLKGEVRFATRDYLVFGKLNPEAIRVIDTIYYENLRYFEFMVELDTPDYYTIDFGSQRVNLLLTGSDLEIVADGNDPFGKGSIKGSLEEDMLMDYRHFIDSLDATEWSSTIKSGYRDAVIRSDSQAIDSIAREFNKWLFYKHGHMTDFLGRYPVNFGHLQGIGVLSDSIAADYKGKVFSELVKKYPTSRNVRHELKNYEERVN